MTPRQMFENCLAPEGRDLMCRIEEFSAREIRFELDPRIEVQAGTECAVGNEDATIFCRDFADITRGSATHELLHISLMWIDRFPYVFPYYGSDLGYAQLNNLVQHLHIIPREGEFGAARPDVWIPREEAKWGAFERLPIHQKLQAATVGRSTLDCAIFDDVPELRIRADNALGEAGLVEARNRYRRAHHALSPAQAFAVLLDILQVGGEHGFVIRDIQNRTSRDQDLPTCPAGY